MKFSALATSSATALALALAACGPDEGPGARRGGPAATEITQDQGETGLAALNLANNPQISWGERRFEDGVFIFTDLAFTPQTEDEEAFTIDQLSLAAPRVDDAGNVEFDRLEALGLNSGAAAEQVRVARIFVEYPGPGLSSAIADVLSGRASAEDYDLEIDDLSRFRFDGLGIEGFEMTESEAESDHPVTMTLAGFAMEDFDGETLATLAMTGLSLTAIDPDSGPVRFNLAEIRVDALDGTLLRGMVDAGGDPEAAMGAMSEWMMPVNLFDRFLVRGLDVDAGGVKVAMPELTSQISERGQDIVMVTTMPALTVTGQDGSEGGTAVAQALTMLGYDSFNFSMRGETVFDPEADRYYTRGENYLQLDDGVRISVDQDFSGYQAYMDRYSEIMAEVIAEEADTKIGEFDPQLNAMMMRAYEPLVLNSLRVAIEDRSLVERALQAAATQQGVSPEEMRTQLVGLIGMGVMMAPPEVPRPLVNSLSQALMAFVQQGGTVVLEAEPEEPVSVGTIMQAVEAGSFDPSMVGLTIIHEPAQ